MRSSILVIDCGSSSMRGILFDAAGEILLVEQRKYFMDIDGDSATQDPCVYSESLYDICTACAAAIKGRGLSLSALSFTSQRSSVLPVDRQGQPVGRIMTWYDKRSAGICREKTAAFGEEIFSITGTRPTPVLSAPKMLWIKRHEPERYSRACKLIGIHDYLLLLCTGEFVTDATLASRSSLMDIRSLSWSDRLLEIFEIDREKLCRLLPPCSAAGRVTPAFAARTGLPEGTLVVSGGGDQQCSVLGQGLFEAGQMGITCGTGAYIAAVCDQPLVDPQQRIDLNAAVCPGRWIAESSIPAAGSVFDWFNRNFYDPSGQRYPQERINADILASPPGANGLVMDPDLISGGSFASIGLSHTRADFARALVEGIAVRIAGCFDVLRAHTGSVSTVKTTGGLTKFPEFNQIISDIIDFSVKNCIIKETTAIGAFLAGAVAAGWYASLPEAYRRLFGTAGENCYEPTPERAAIYQKVKQGVKEVT